MKIRVMIVDDSVVFRGFWAGLLAHEDDIEVVTTAVNGKDAVERIATRSVDVVLLDVEMPVMDGLEAIPHLLKASPRSKIIMASSQSTSGSKVTLQALTHGAHDFVSKPGSIVASASTEQLKADLLLKIRGMVAHEPVVGPVAKVPLVTLRGAQKPAVLLIGSSTGGPAALAVVLSKLDRNLQIPILIVQHMPPEFTPLLAEQLAKDSGRTCREAVHGELVKEQMIYLAPGGKHMKVVKTQGRVQIELTDDEAENFCKPAVDVLFRSAAEALGGAALALVLTGMGEDGLKGAEILKRQGVLVVVQDESSSVVWGMPGAIAKAGIADHVFALGELGEKVSKLCLR